MGFLSKYHAEKFAEAGVDLEFLRQIQPQGNLNFKYDRFYYGGDGYYTVLHLYQYPSVGLGNFWLHDLMQIEGARSFLSLYHINSQEIQKQLSKSIGEKESRISGKAKSTDNQRELDEIHDMMSLYREVTQQNAAMVGFYVRIFVTAPTEEKLFKKVDEIKDKLARYKMTILIGELDYEYLAPFIPPSKQIKLPNKRRGTVARARDIAGGYFFNHTKLEDQHGSYYGFTPTNGAVNFNFLERDDKRTRSFMLISGNPSMGQTTFSLKVNDDLYAKGHFLRNFDSDGTFTKQTRKQQGLILDLSGSQNRINPFQVFPTVTNSEGTAVDEIRSFQLHIEKLKNMFKMLNDDATGDDMTVFKKVATNFYIDHHIWYRNPRLHEQELRATKIRKEEYPILSDFVNYLYDVERMYAQKRTATNSFVLASITRIKQTFESALQTHAGIFEGTTEFQDISSEQVVTFDFSALKGEPSIYNAQVFSVLSLVSADVTNNGKHNKRVLQANPGLNEANLPHYVVNIAKAENLINPRYQRSVDLLADIMTSMGENYAGIILSVQSLQGILFEAGTSTNDPYVVAVKRIFGLMQYRVFAQTAETDIPLLANALAGSMNKSELETLPKLRKKQLFMNIAGVGNLVFKQQFLSGEEERYGGWL